MVLVEAPAFPRMAQFDRCRTSACPPFVLQGASHTKLTLSSAAWLQRFNRARGQFILIMCFHQTIFSVNEKKSSPQLWGGFECTVNRLDDSFMDQLELSGHAQRPSDLDLLAEIGFKAVRYPVLWERVAANGIENIDWSWSDQRLAKLRQLGIRPIIGLVHHGSGPLVTNLLDPSFPGRLAKFARAVAERYPWVDAYTPINEPLTTARFSCLYGHWYPHLKNDRSFLQALFHQCRAIVLAMREIRQVNSQAQLIQTEDLAKVHSTPELAYQADFENERRWLPFDLLCGHVDSHHPLWGYFHSVGVKPAELSWFQANPCPPDIMGMNYYLTGERFLDHRLECYPNCPPGGNGRQSYVDVEAARVLRQGIDGSGALLREAWRRFHFPLAITELHNGCTREEQARWFLDQWNSAAALLQEGIDLRAITAWALLGSFNWNTLVTREGTYEPGVYDVRGPRPHPTFLVQMLRQLARGEAPNHPVLDGAGWWRRSTRHIFGVSFELGESQERRLAPLRKERPILIAGATGTLGRAFSKICADRGLAHRALGRSEMDIADPASVRAAVQRLQPWAIINAAGYVQIDDAEVETERCYRENTIGPAVLASVCAGDGLQLLTFSSDFVFDGKKQAPYRESDAVSPLNVYGHTKAEAEKAVLTLCPSALVVRTSTFFGSSDRSNFVTRALRALAAGEKFTAVSDYVVSPTYVPDLVHASLDLLIDGARGIWHLVNRGAVNWAELASMAAQAANVSTSTLTIYKRCDWMFPAVRPHYSALESERANIMPTLQDALSRYLGDPCLSWIKVESGCSEESQDDIAA